MLTRKYLLLSLCALCTFGASINANAQSTSGFNVTFSPNSIVTVAGGGNSTNSIVQLIPPSSAPLTAPVLNVNTSYPWSLQNDGSYKASMYFVSSNNTGPGSNGRMNGSYSANAIYNVKGPADYSLCRVRFEVSHGAMAAASCGFEASATAAINSVCSIVNGDPIGGLSAGGSASSGNPFTYSDSATTICDIPISLEQFGNESVGSVSFAFGGSASTSTNGSLSGSAYAQAGSQMTIKILSVYVP
ncbi:MAG: hypothetical protein H8F28_09560 [Fibrella sp.]|nr:hypothetical protein [Armatimonadota bacterium]